MLNLLDVSSAVRRFHTERAPLHFAGKLAPPAQPCHLSLNAGGTMHGGVLKMDFQEAAHLSVVLTKATATVVNLVPCDSIWQSFQTAELLCAPGASDFRAVKLEASPAF